jgi:hypothetical protein
MIKVATYMLYTNEEYSGKVCHGFQGKIQTIR